MPLYDLKYWQTQIKASKKMLDEFHTAGDNVVAEYLDSEEAARNDEGLDARKINMFWANIGILKAALYGNPPKPLASREFQDPEDDVGRVAASIMERLLQTGPNGSGADMHEALQHCVEDRLIPGMGQLWLRYDAKVVDVEVEPGVQGQKIQDENVITDYVYWKDFYYGTARVWGEVPWVARRVWMTEEVMKTRFGAAKIKDIPFVVPEEGRARAATSSEEDSGAKRGEIYEIWCKSTRKAHWIVLGFDTMLDERDDPLKLPNFFPCPRPLLANTTTKKLIGRSDFTMVRGQYDQLNQINVRLGYLIEACKAVGVYDKSADGVSRMLKEGVENQLIPVDNWAMFAEKGGIKGVVDWLPIEAIVIVIEKLREQRADVVQQIYELTGISDIMRGVTNARETYGAQKLKSQYSSSRLQLYQMQVGSFVAESMDIKAMIISKHFQPETIVRKSLVMMTADRQYAEQAVALIKNSWQLMYRINISSTQMSIPDYNAEKQMRQEYVTAMGQFVSQITPLVQQAPGAAPFMLKILQWAGASFSTSGGVETLFDNYIREVEKQLQAPPSPDPEVAKAQAEGQLKTQIAQQEGQVKQSLAQFDVQSKQALAGIDAKLKVDLANLEIASKERIAQLDAETKLQIANINQDQLWQGELMTMEQKQGKLDKTKSELQQEHDAAAAQTQYIIDTALMEIKNLVQTYEHKMNEKILQAKAKPEEKKENPTADTTGMQKMHSELITKVSGIVEGMKALTAPKSISITLPDGGKASAEVTPNASS